MAAHSKSSWVSRKRLSLSRLPWKVPFANVPSLPYSHPNGSCCSCHWAWRGVVLFGFSCGLSQILLETSKLQQWQHGGTLTDTLRNCHGALIHNCPWKMSVGLGAGGMSGQEVGLMLESLRSWKRQEICIDGSLNPRQKKERRKSRKIRGLGSRK